MLCSSGPFAPNHKEPTELTEPEIKRLKETAKTFGYGRSETLDRGNLVKINKATEGFRKLYVGALTANTTEKDLDQYFSTFGNVDFVQVIRSKDTGQTKGTEIPSPSPLGMGNYYDDFRVWICDYGGQRGGGEDPVPGRPRRGLQIHQGQSDSHRQESRLGTSQEL